MPIGILPSLLIPTGTPLSFCPSTNAATLSFTLDARFARLVLALGLWRDLGVPESDEAEEAAEEERARLAVLWWWGEEGRGGERVCWRERWESGEREEEGAGGGGSGGGEMSSSVTLESERRMRTRRWERPRRRERSGGCEKEEAEDEAGEKVRGGEEALRRMEDGRGLLRGEDGDE